MKITLPEHSSVLQTSLTTAQKPTLKHLLKQNAPVKQNTQSPCY